MGFTVEEFTWENLPRPRNQAYRRFAFPLACARQLLAAQRRGHSYHAAIIHEPSGAAVALIRRLRITQTRLVVVSHNPEQKVWELNKSLTEVSGHRIPWRTRLLWPVTRLWQSNLALRWADHVLCLSTEDQAFLAERFAIPSHRLSRTHNGVESHFFDITADYRRPRLLFMGSWLTHKGIDTLRRAIPELLERHAGLLVTLAGVGMPESMVRSHFPTSLQPRMRVLSAIAPEALSALYSQHNIFVLPSWYEGMPLSLLEAMAAGLSVTASAVGGIQDVVRHERDGLLVPPRDLPALTTALSRLAGCSDLRGRMGRAARERARAFSWHSAVQTIAAAASLRVATTASATNREAA